VLIANRGEIAIRIMRSCKKLGIKTVAVYSEPDANAVRSMALHAHDDDCKQLHVRTADEKYCIGPALSVQSYLNFDRYAEALKATGADAVHPGYGFLSEKYKFVDMLDKMGVTFIGPPSSAMQVCLHIPVCVTDVATAHGRQEEQQAGWNQGEDQHYPRL
jgi:propionyl-CoA carboxylase alpha chain